MLPVVSCRINDSIEDIKIYKGNDINGYSVIITDTLRIDASATSLKGEWDIRGDRLYFTDYSLVRVREYDRDGIYQTSHINRGRGPGESPSPFNTVCFDSEGNLVTLDQSWSYKVFDSTMTQTIASYRFLSETSYKQGDWNRLLFNPDPEIDNMYEFNLDVRDMKPYEKLVVVPVYTEHVSFNGYSTRNNKRFWRESYNYMLIDPYDGRIVSKFGHFPSCYLQRRIPTFSSYSFDVDKKGQIVTTYAADTLIYVQPSPKEVEFAFGRSFSGFDGMFPEVKSFDEYLETYDLYREEAGYFQTIKVEDEFIFRGYKLPGDRGYGVQVYRDYNYVTDVYFHEPVRIIGQIGGDYYGAAPPDMSSDSFIIYKIRICSENF